jgi:hypothetical protein
MNISISTSDKGHHILLHIWDVTRDEPILTFDKWFQNEEQIETFKKTKLFKNVFNAVFKIRAL